MAPPTGIRLFNPRKMWAVVTSLMLAILITSAYGIWRTANDENQKLVEVQKDILIRSRFSDLQQRNYRSFVESIGQEFTQLFIQIRGKKIDFSVGSRPEAGHCAESSLLPTDSSPENEVGVTICRPFRSPLMSLVGLVAVFFFASVGSYMVFLKLEKSACKALADFIKDCGVKIDESKGLWGILARIQDVVSELGAAKSRELKLAKSAAIAETAQMLAHDIRKPFWMLKSALDALADERDPNRISALASRLMPQVQKELTFANNMISDVMEYGSLTSPVIEPTSFNAILRAVLDEITRLRDISPSAISLSLTHERNIQAESAKIYRVLSNIVDNAVSAATRPLNVWIRTREIQDESQSFLEVCIGNRGSVIEQGDICKIFDPFFTKGKKGGTGLGLAIARKIVVSHGGKIWCISDESSVTEFFFTLPLTLDRHENSDIGFSKKAGAVATPSKLSLVEAL